MNITASQDSTNELFTLIHKYCVLMFNVTWTDEPQSRTWGGWAAPGPRVCPRPSCCLCSPPGCQLLIPDHSHSLLTKVIVMPSCVQLTGHCGGSTVSALASVRTQSWAVHSSLGLRKGCCPEQHNTESLQSFVTLNNKHQPTWCRRIGSWKIERFVTQKKDVLFLNIPVNNKSMIDIIIILPRVKCCPLRCKRAITLLQKIFKEKRSFCLDVCSLQGRILQTEAILK